MSDCCVMQWRANIIMKTLLGVAFKHIQSFWILLDVYHRWWCFQKVKSRKTNTLKTCMLWVWSFLALKNHLWYPNIDFHRNELTAEKEGRNQSGGLLFRWTRRIECVRDLYSVDVVLLNFKENLLWCFFLCLMVLQEGKTMYEQELYHNFSISSSRSYFISFAGDVSVQL